MASGPGYYHRRPASEEMTVGHKTPYAFSGIAALLLTAACAKPATTIAPGGTMDVLGPVPALVPNPVPRVSKSVGSSGVGCFGRGAVGRFVEKPRVSKGKNARPGTNTFAYSHDAKGEELNHPMRPAHHHSDH